MCFYRKKTLLLLRNTHNCKTYCTERDKTFCVTKKEPEGNWQTTVEEFFSSMQPRFHTLSSTMLLSIKDYIQFTLVKDVMRGLNLRFLQRENLKLPYPSKQQSRLRHSG